jgi:hypothetical protein
MGSVGSIVCGDLKSDFAFNLKLTRIELELKIEKGVAE